MLSNDRKHKIPRELEVFPILTQRKTQTAAYWQEQFKVKTEDIEFIYNQILDTNRLFTVDELATAVVKRHCDAEELATRSELQRGKLYQPQEQYAVGEKIVFPTFNFALGTVQDTRAGKHPAYGPFTVLSVVFENDEATHEFAASFDYPHPLNIGDEQSLANLQGLMSPEELYQTFRRHIRPRVKATLNENEEFVEFHDQYYLRDLLVDFHEGLFNIADAAIDINQGPLSVDALTEQMGLAEDGNVTDVLRFSVNYRLANDPRFDDVGPKGQVLWYLERMEPPEAHHPPRRLQATTDQSYDPTTFDDEFLAILADIDDELTDPDDIPTVGPESKTVTVTLNYPHWRVGSLPLTPKTESFFPISYYNPVRFEFVDGRTGDTFPGWSAYHYSYVFGLEQWYQKNKLPVGAYITLKRTDDPLRVIVDYPSIRAQREWIRVATVVNKRLSFQMSTEAIGCKYDELMIIGDQNTAQIDRLWLDAEDRELPLFNILTHVFPELAKLNPQSTVHFKTLYNAANVLRRFGPGVVFEALNHHTCFIPMNHGYWTYDPSLRDD
jgi:hypothetical protein